MINKALLVLGFIALAFITVTEAPPNRAEAQYAGSCSAAMAGCRRNGGSPRVLQTKNVGGRSASYLSCTFPGGGVSHIGCWNN